MTIEMKVEVPDTGGLICGFRLRAQGTAEPLRWSAATTAPGAVAGDGDTPLWLHFNLADTRADQWIAACERIPAAARELLLDNDARIHIESVGDGLAGVIGDLHHDFDIDPEGLGVLRLYIGESLIVSARRHPLESSNRLRRELLGGLPLASPIGWLVQLVHNLAESFGAVVVKLGESADEIEDRILAGRLSHEGMELGRMRRLLARLRRLLSANRQALVHARARLPGWCSEGDAAQLRLAIERLDAVSQDLELVQERSRLLQEEIAGRLGEATNRNLYLLSIVTAVMLPVTLITGIFGMNVGGLPWLQHTHGFWWVMFLMALTAAGTLAVLRWLKLF